MKVRKFLAGTSREALRQVKEELGPDAVILSSQQAGSGVEIMALASVDMSCLMGTLGPTPQLSGVGAAASVLAVSGEARRPDSLASKKPIAEPVAQSIISEIQNMRGMLEEQLATLAWGDMQRREPNGTKILRVMLNAGFSPSLSRQLLDELPAGRDREQSLNWAKGALAGNLHTVAGDEIIDRGGAYALIGPTGVGKTTTVAKLAARCVVRHGADQVALLTTDSYRIGGHEQLRIYGKLLGVPVRAINDAEDLQLTLSELHGKRMVLIDTVGMGQRDQMVAGQVAMLSDCGCDVKRLLLLNATGNGDTLDDVVRAYRGNGLQGCIITKVDEAASLGVVLDTVIRHKLVLHYVANGQKVPEDLHLASAGHLLHRAFEPVPGDSPFALQDAEYALVMAGTGNAASHAIGARAGAGHG
ncbi:MAG: flagellar biosynthesis protein FlhF [Betaproteobacteria bacterium]|nr:flagellar biosynthesis protein FlhF [Betaproteobacteria bacterium]MBI3053271.1 flagellar biosynthesis protein FlhF [Betaproteobacteria bacterium]